MESNSTNTNSTNNNNLARINRYRYFQVFIYEVEDKKLTSLVELENALYDLEIKYRESKIHLENFHGQLEKDLLGLFYWHIIMETNKVVTKRLLAKNLSRVLFGKRNEVDRRIKVNSLVKLVKLCRERMCCVRSSKFFPGFFSKNYLKYEKLSTSKDVLERLSFKPDIKPDII